MSETTSFTLFLDLSSNDSFAVSISKDEITTGDTISLTCEVSKYDFDEEIKWLFWDTKSNNYIPADRIEGNKFMIYIQRWRSSERKWVWNFKTIDSCNIGQLSINIWSNSGIFPIF